MMRAVRMGIAAVLTAGLVVGCVDSTLRRRGPGTREVAVEHYQKAIKHIEAQDIDRAILEVRRAIDTDPTKAVYHRLYGNLLAQQGEYVQAELAYRQAISRDPYDDESWRGRVQVVRQQGDKERVPLVIRERVRVEPLNADWRIELGLAYEDLGELLGAEREFRAAADLATGHRAAYAHARLGLVYEALGRPKAAIREYEESLKLNPDQTQVKDFLDRLKAGSQ